MRTGVIVEGERIPADVAVIAMGPWSGIAAQWLPGLLVIYGEKANSVVVRPAEPVPPQMLFTKFRHARGLS